MKTMSPSQQAERWAALFLRVRSIIRRFWWIPLLTVSLALAVGGVIALRQETWYRSSAKLMVSGRIQVSDANAYSEDGSNFLGTQEVIIKSSKVLEPAEARVRADAKVAPAPVSGLDVSVLPGTSILLLQVTAQTAEYSQAYLDAVIQEYIELKRGMRRETSDSAHDSLQDGMKKLDEDREKNEKAADEFLKKNSLVFLKQGENTAAKYLAELTQRLADLETQKQMYDTLQLDQLQSLPHAKKPGPSANGAAKTDSTPDGGKEQETPELQIQTDYLRDAEELDILQQKRQELERNLREDHADIVALNAQIAEKERMLKVHREVAKNEVEAHKNSLQSQIEVLEAQVEDWKKKALEIGTQMAEYNRIQANVERDKTAYDRIAQSIGSVDLTKTLGQDVISVLEKPSTPETVRPGMSRILSAAAVLGLFIGVGILFLLDRSSAQIASPEEFVADFTERLIGLVPREREPGDTLQMADKRHAFAEAFFNLRSSLLFLEYDGPMPKVLLITSSIPNEGKSTLSANIALAFAFAGSKTLLIDGDLRRGAVHETFHIDNEKGLSEILQQRCAWRDAVHATATPKLFVIPRGGHISQPSKYFVHSSTDELLREIYKEYDQVIIDSCPVLAADDTTSLAPKVDAVLVIARMGVVSRRHVLTTLTSLRTRQANVLGCILNGVDERMTGYSYYSYAQYYNRDERPQIEEVAGESKKVKGRKGAEFASAILECAGKRSATALLEG